MELKEGQKLKVKEFDERPKHWESHGKMDKWMGKIVTFKRCYNNKSIEIYEDCKDFKNGSNWRWEESDFQIVFDTWEDVRNTMEEECRKYNSCKNCPLGYIENGICYNIYCNEVDYKEFKKCFEKMFGMECYVLEDDNMDFKLENIKDEMIVKLRNKNIYIALGENFININGFIPKYKYLQNFKCRSNSDFDIIEVYQANKKYGYGFEGMLIIDEDVELLWKEINDPITKDVSLEEINDLLKEKYPDVEKFNLPIDK